MCLVQVHVERNSPNRLFKFSLKRKLNGIKSFQVSREQRRQNRINWFKLNTALCLVSVTYLPVNSCMGMREDERREDTLDKEHPETEIKSLYKGNIFHFFV